jgi:periplasmic copper chaperone A
MGAAAALGALVIAASGGAAASAHVEPKVDTFKAGSTGTVTFATEHGCNGSPTVKIAMRLPAGVANPVPVAKKGWTATVSTDKTVVTWAGGPLPSKQHGSFAVKLTFTGAKGTKVVLPVVQTCKVGVNRWVDTAKGSDYPAPVITLT